MELRLMKLIDNHEINKNEVNKHIVKSVKDGISEKQLKDFLNGTNQKIKDNRYLMSLFGACSGISILSVMYLFPNYDNMLAILTMGAGFFASGLNNLAFLELAIENIKMKKCKKNGLDYEEYKDLYASNKISFDDFLLLKKNNISIENYLNNKTDEVNFLAREIVRKRYSPLIAEKIIESGNEKAIALDPNKYQSKDHVVKQIKKSANKRIVISSILMSVGGLGAIASLCMNPQAGTLGTVAGGVFAVGGGLSISEAINDKKNISSLNGETEDMLEEDERGMKL